MTRKNRLHRGLALVLCLCMLVPYLPVPGHAEGCGHVHGEECYQEVTQCVHTHEDACWSDPEARDAGEEPDACAHVCGEDTGCVTRELNCAHVHDDTCGEQPREEPEPEPEEPQPEEPEEPKPEVPEQEEENQPLVISRWEWVDEEAVLDPETGVLCLSAEEPILFEQVVELLPKAILATVGEETQTVPLDHWDPKDYPQETGANSGTYLLAAALPEGYALSEDAAALTVQLEFAQAQVLADCGHENVDMDTGKCKDCNEQVYQAKIGDVGYATLGEALEDAQKKENKNCTVTLLCEVDLGVRWHIDSGIFTLDLNKKNNTLGIYLWGGELTIRNGGMKFSDVPVVVTDDGILRIESGTYTGGRGSLQRGGGTMLISGGEFLKGIESVNKPIVDSLADGKAFFSDPECEQLKDASVGYLEGPLYVGPHTDKYEPVGDGTYKCGCGRVCETCDHTKVNMETGKCLCGQKQLYEAKIGNTGYTTLWDALDAAQGMQNACTITLLCDVTFSKPYTMDKGTVTLDLNGNFFRSDEGFDINGGSLTLQGGSMLTALQVKDGTLCIESGQYQGFLIRNGGEVILSGGTFLGGMKMQNMRGSPVADFLANGTAFYDDFVNPSELIDASSDSLTNYVTYSIRTHTDTYSSTTGKCPCGRTIPQATLSAAPTANTLTYDGTDQPLVTAGTAQNGRLLYSLEENGAYEEAIPTGKQADTYTVWYYVEGTAGKYYNTEKQSLTVTVGKKDLTPVVTIPDRDFDGTREVRDATVTLNGKVDGDDLTYTLGTLEFDAAIPGDRTATFTKGTPELKGSAKDNYNLMKPTGLTGRINATSRYLDVTTSLPNADSVTVDGEEYQVKVESGKRYVMLPDTGSLLTVYTYQTNADNKTYPDTMQVFAIDRQNTGSTLTEIPEFKDLLLYEGCSIRLNGTKGIRMITSISQENKKALVGSGLAGYTLVEYGTVITRESTLGGKPLNLTSGKSNYAYSKANKKDPVFKTESGRIQYTNVLVGFQPADYKTELVLRAYIKLRDASGNEVVLYGGCVTRSIDYIAQQNIGDYKPGSVGYKYLDKILNGQA